MPTIPPCRFASAPRAPATVAAGFVTGMLAGLSARDKALSALLAASGVPDKIRRDASVRIPVDRYAALYNALVREFDDEGFALFATPLRTGSFEFLCRSVITASTLADALERAGRFLRLVLPDFAVSVGRQRATAQLRLRLEAASPLADLAVADPGRVFAFEWLLRLLHALACWLVGRGLALDTVSFPYPRPPHADDYALIYTENSLFAPAASPDATLVASFSANLLDLPIRRDDAALASFLDGAPGKIALLYRRDRATVLRVRDLLRQALPELPPLGVVARRLNLSERSLHRRLEEEGTNFRAIRDALRRDIALARLTKTNQALSQIAAELGYAEPSAFYRAVVGWTGVAPSEYRRRSAG
jgi:AraC-like DNA-binding protein